MLTPMTSSLSRRGVLASALALPLTSALTEARAAAPNHRSRLKLSCNLYSFNAPLTSGEMSLEQVIDLCAELGFEAVDPTGYYFKGYPTPA